jgi:hypothetical protein
VLNFDIEIREFFSFGGIGCQWTLLLEDLSLITVPVSNWALAETSEDVSSLPIFVRRWHLLVTFGTGVSHVSDNQNFLFISNLLIFFSQSVCH